MSFIITKTMLSSHISILLELNLKAHFCAIIKERTRDFSGLSFRVLNFGTYFDLHLFLARSSLPKANAYGLWNSCLCALNLEHDAVARVVLNIKKHCRSQLLPVFSVDSLVH